MSSGSDYGLSIANGRFVPQIAPRRLGRTTQNSKEPPMKSLPILVAVLSAAIAVGAAAAAPRTQTYVLQGAAVFPEGIAFDEKTGFFYVSSTSDGSILRGHVKDTTATTFVAPTGVPFSSIGLKVENGRIYVAGGFTGTVRVYDQATGALRSTFTSGAGGFLNDLAVAKNGDVFVTDSTRPILWRIPAGSTGGALEPWLSFVGTPFQYRFGPNEFNANGIAATPDGKYLIVAQANAGKLFLIEIATKRVTEIDLGGQTLPGADGIVLRGRSLYVVSNGGIAEVRLSGQLTSGTVVSRTTDPSFNSPTTNAIARGRMLVVNSQFGALFSGQPPTLPFTVSSIKIP